MTAMEKWSKGADKINQINVRVSDDQLAYLRRLSLEYRLSVSQVVRDLMLDGLAVYEKRIKF